MQPCTSSTVRNHSTSVALQRLTFQTTVIPPVHPVTHLIQEFRILLLGELNELLHAALALDRVLRDVERGEGGKEIKQGRGESGEWVTSTLALFFLIDGGKGAKFPKKWVLWLLGRLLFHRVFSETIFLCCYTARSTIENLLSQVSNVFSETYLTDPVSSVRSDNSLPHRMKRVDSWPVATLRRREPAIQDGCFIYRGPNMRMPCPNILSAFISLYSIRSTIVLFSSLSQIHPYYSNPTVPCRRCPW